MRSWLIAVLSGASLRVTCNARIGTETTASASGSLLTVNLKRKSTCPNAASQRHWSSGALFC